MTFAELKAKGFRSVAKRIDDIDLPKLGHLIGVGEDEIHAVLDVEASGSGFDSEGRPKILFEPHVFYRNLPSSLRAMAVAKGLAYKDWKPGNYPKDSYPRLHQALEIHETAALKACSWGLAQILGENHVAAGYETPQEMVVAFCEDEEHHLAAMVSFIKYNHLDDELRRHDWAGFARGYNGVGYKANSYDTKLAAAYAWWRKKPDTPWSPDAPLPAPVEPAPIEPTPVVITPARSGPLWDAYVALAAHFGEPPMPSKPTPFVGSILIPIVADVVKDAAIKAAQKVAIPHDPDPFVVEETVAEVKNDPRLREIEARLEHLTNTEPEPLKQSRVVQGGTAGTVAGVVVTLIGLAKIFGYDLEAYREDLILIGGGAVTTLSAVWVLYGRLKAKYPLFFVR